MLRRLALIQTQPLTLANHIPRYLHALSDKNTTTRTTHATGQRMAIGFTVLIERLALALRRLPLRAA